MSIAYCGLGQPISVFGNGGPPGIVGPCTVRKGGFMPHPHILESYFWKGVVTLRLALIRLTPARQCMLSLYNSIHLLFAVCRLLAT
jgi:hypothetical protein